MSGLPDLYRDAVRRHAADPTGRGRAIEATHRHELHNAQCGDRIDLCLRIDGERIEDAAFDGEGCAICLASASLLCAHLPGAAIADLHRLSDTLDALLAGRIGPEDAGPLAPLAGVRPYPSRVRCATLPWQAALRALEEPRDD